jgi:Ser/Thr protein kinase RdoA (MazF antagonist)
MEALVRRILQTYGYTDVELFAPGKGYRNHSYPAQLPDGSLLNVMLYKREPGMLERIRRANQVSDFAYSRGLPTRHTHDARVIRLTSTRGESYAALYEYLPGTTIPWEAYTMRHIKLLGKGLSDLHAVLAGLNTAGIPRVVPEYEQIIEHMRAYFAKPGVQEAVQRKLGLIIDDTVFKEFKRLLATCSHLSGQQVLHMDFVRSNILFDDTGGELHISGILDFEKTAVGIPLFDIARTLAFLLVDCKYKEAEKIRKYFLRSGYQKRGAAIFKNITVTIGSDHRIVLDQLVELFLFYDFYKFLRHNPYEFLSENEHYIRTRDILLDYQLIAASS